MQRQTIAVLAFSCVLTSVGHAQVSGSGISPVPPTHGSQKPPTVAATGGSSSTSGAHPDAVAMDQPVITLKGGCTAFGDITPAKDCVSTVTRAQFEKLTNALQPDMPAEAKRGLATNYGKLLVFSDVARALHLENDPNIQLIIQFVTEQVLAEGVRRHYTEQFAHPTDQQIQAYYAQNSAKYLEATLQRIIIPRKPGPNDKSEVSEAERNAVAEKLRQRWLAGEDPVKLQQAAYEAASLSAAGTPDVSLGARRPGSMPVNQESVFQLKSGEVSQVYSDPGASYVYKVVSVRQIPLSEVKDSIIKTLQQQQLQEKMEEISKSATPVLNDEYFGPAPPSRAPAMGGRPAPGGPPQPGPPTK